MELIPAIDLMQGKVVRLTQGDPNTVKTYTHFGDPVTVARKWEDAGADALHVIDLDAVFNKGNNLHEIRKIVQTINIPLQVGGGIRSFVTAENLLRLGVDRIIVGSLAFTDTQTLTKLLEAFGHERIVVALDHREGEVLVRGWRDTTKLVVSEAVTKFLALGVKLYLVTSVTKDGTLTGPDSGIMTIVRNNPEANIIAAGGVRNLEDLITLKRIGVWGVVIGKALYEGVLDLKEATKIGKA